MGFEHLVNDSEKFRVRIIELNDELYNLNNMINYFEHDDISRRDLILKYYKTQDLLNRMYRISSSND